MKKCTIYAAGIANQHLFFYTQPLKKMLSSLQNFTDI